MPWACCIVCSYIWLHSCILPVYGIQAARDSTHEDTDGEGQWPDVVCAQRPAVDYLLPSILSTVSQGVALLLLLLLVLH